MLCPSVRLAVKGSVATLPAFRALDSGFTYGTLVAVALRGPGLPGSSVGSAVLSAGSSVRGLGVCHGCCFCSGFLVLSRLVPCAVLRAVRAASPPMGGPSVASRRRFCPSCGRLPVALAGFCAVVFRFRVVLRVFHGRRRFRVRRRPCGPLRVARCRSPVRRPLVGCVGSGCRSSRVAPPARSRRVARGVFCRCGWFFVAGFPPVGCRLVRLVLPFSCAACAALSPGHCAGFFMGSRKKKRELAVLTHSATRYEPRIQDYFSEGVIFHAKCTS